mmetsp:Transcript_8351/g.28061  ORF Transcript_8351/g.28061 Transcript_8351/m.28061 type:complete len:361 (+) Transcript_8351:690-1772(+)
MHMDLHRLPSADRTVILPLVRECVGVDRVSSLVHHIVPSTLRAHVPRHRSRKLENFVCTGRSDDGVSGSDGWNDPLGNALGELERHPLDPELLCSFQRRLVEPLHVLGVVALEVGVVTERPHTVPLQLLRPLHTVRGGARDVGEGAHGEVDLRGEEGEDALEAGSHEGVDNIDVAGKTLRPSVDHRDVGAWLYVPVIVELREAADHVIHPPPRLQRVQPEDDNLELLVKVSVLLLDLAEVRGDAGAGDALVDEVGCHNGLGLTHVALSEQELTVQVGDLNRVHIDHVDVEKAKEGEIFQQLASQPSSSNHKHSDQVVQELLGLIARKEVRARARTWSGEQAIQILPPTIRIDVNSHLDVS